MSALKVTAAGLMDIDGTERSAIVLEGARDAIREGCKHFGDDVVIVNADLHRDMLEALQGLQQFFALPDECSIGRFDRLAEQYRRETGNWAPGKSIPDAYNDSTDCETRRKEYDDWVQSKVDAARAAIARATGADT